MNLPPTPAPPVSGGPLRARRCFRHAQREAIARCPSCGGFFCRECVVEHEGKLVCAVCLTKAQATTRTAPGPGLAARIRRAGAAALSLVFLWMLFYLFGQLLVRIPPQLHDGSVWKRAASGP